MFACSYNVFVKKPFLNIFQKQKYVYSIDRYERNVLRAHCTGDKISKAGKVTKGLKAQTKLSDNDIGNSPSNMHWKKIIIHRSLENNEGLILKKQSRIRSRNLIDKLANVPESSITKDCVSIPLDKYRYHAIALFANSNSNDSSRVFIKNCYHTSVGNYARAKDVDRRRQEKLLDEAEEEQDLGYDGFDNGYVDELFEKNSNFAEPRLTRSRRQLKHEGHLSSSDEYKNVTLPRKELERLFPNPKHTLHQVYSHVTNQLKITDCCTSTSKLVPQKQKKELWEFTYTVKWPEEMSFSATGVSKRAACDAAVMKCLNWLHVNEKIKNGVPVLNVVNDRMDEFKKPTEIKVPEEYLNDIQEIIGKYNKEIKHVVSESISNSAFRGNTIRDTTISKGNEFLSKADQGYQDLLGQRIEAPTLREEMLRNNELEAKVKHRRVKPQESLPIFEYRDTILEELNKNQVILIKGDTGCGKTTQVPQFIMDHFSKMGQGASCNIIVSQPRRISATSLAQRIASERGEVVGDVIGYQVRLQHVFPKTPGAILFCTTGMLLRKLQHSPTLEGCSHVIVDEAHERHVATDMLLALLKRALAVNAQLKVIIMSATINSELFQKYYNCRAIEVPGRMYPVEMNFMEDIKELSILNSRDSPYNKLSLNCPVIEPADIGNLILWIHDHKPQGAILCFLPGWREIVGVHYVLTRSKRANSLEILSLHSKVSNSEQNRIFEKARPGVRKVILATDIAETGITVTDVVYVVDSALRRETRLLPEKNMISMENQWVAKANVDQRRGRAGRVRPGTSYHFLTRNMYQQLAAQPMPEVLRISLEQVVLDAKTFSQERAEDFLGSLPEPPTRRAVNHAITDLIQLGALDHTESLTPLGKRIAFFTIHPKLSKALVLSTIFNCINPVATIASILSADSEFFQNVLTNKSNIKNVKKRFQPSSDHLALAWIYAQWSLYDKQKPQLENEVFCEQILIQLSKMRTLHRVRHMILNQLIATRIIKTEDNPDHLESMANRNSEHDELIRGVLLAGVDNILQHKGFEIRKGLIRKNLNQFTCGDGSRAALTPDSVNYKREHWPSKYLTYFQGTHSGERRMLLIRDTSMISPLTVLLFTQENIRGRQYSSDSDKILIMTKNKKNVRFLCDRRTAETLVQFRDVLWQTIRYLIEREGTRNANYAEDLEQVREFKDELLSCLVTVLDNSAELIDKGEPEAEENRAK